MRAGTLTVAKTIFLSNIVPGAEGSVDFRRCSPRVQVADMRTQMRNEGAKAQAAFEKKARKAEEDLRRTLADLEKADEVRAPVGGR